MHLVKASPSSFVRKTPDIPTQSGPVVVYSSAERWGSEAQAVAGMTADLERAGIRTVVVAKSGEVAREFIFAGLDTSVLEAGDETRRVRQAIRSVGADFVVVNRDDERLVAAKATSGLGITVVTGSWDLVSVVRRHQRAVRLV